MTMYNTMQYKSDLYSAISRKRIGGACRQCLDRLCGSVCRGRAQTL